MNAENPNGKQPQDELVTTHHSIAVDGRELRYTVTTGRIILKEEQDKPEKDEKNSDKTTPADILKPKAAIFFTAYTLDPEDGADEAAFRRARPLTFAFNGGPGSSSVWLHLGLLGPRRVVMGDVGELVPPPFDLTDNEYTLLDVTDLVFIDPVTTGFSRALPGEDPKQFHGFQKDIESVGDFIQHYTSRYQRWLSPKFLAGESYGTTRSAGLSGYLQERHGLYLNGIMLISAILNFQTVRFMPGNDLPYILFLPTYTATAWYHHRLADDLQADLQAALTEAEEFALNEYALALLRGDSLLQKERETIAEKLARLTGLSREYILRTNLRVQIHRFVKELLRQQRRTVGRLDTRFTGVDRDAAGETFEFDPSYAAIQGPYTAAFNDYVRGELNYASELPYEILTYRVYPWSYKEHENQFVNVGETLRKAMSINPYLKVFVANGYYDLATPYFATRYTFDHLELDESLQKNISMGYYKAGHMMYVHLPSMKQLKADLRGFIQGALPA